MDPVTHVAFAACCAVGAVRAPARRRVAALAGIAGGLWPDADILLRSADDPLFQLEFHRHFTHSLVCSPLMAVLAAGSAWLLLGSGRRTTPWRNLLWPALIGVWSHLFCDLWTTYGTRVLWPFAGPISFDWVSLIDPILTLPLLAGAVLALRRRTRRPALLGICWAATWLVLAATQHHRAESGLRQWLAARGIAPVRLMVKPSFANILVWRGLWEHDGQFHAAAVRPGLPGDVRLKPGASVPVLAPGDAGLAALQPDSRMAEDVRRFARFSEGWTAWVPGEAGHAIGDLRFAARPDAMQPLWGIGIDPAQPDRHATWRTWRKLGREAFAPLVELLRGRGFPDDDVRAP
jgi:inner membrane protein